MKFTIGDIVLNKEAFGGLHTSWVADPIIPKSLIVHGKTAPFKENDFSMKVVNIYKNFYICEYKDRFEDYVRLGFAEENLELIESISKNDFNKYCNKAI